MGTKQGSYYTKGFDVRDLECAIMHNSNDAIFCLRAGFTTPFGRKQGTSAHWYQIKGTKQSVEWSRSTLDKPKAYVHGEDWSEHPEWGTADPEAAEEFRNAAHGGADYYPMHFFMDAILNDTEPSMDVYQAVETAAPAILAAESARRGGELIEVPDFRI
jgi:predicted dehydrogenase